MDQRREAISVSRDEFSLMQIGARPYRSSTDRFCGGVISGDHTVIRIDRLVETMTDDNYDRDEAAEDEQRHQPEREREDVRDRASEDRAMSGDPGGRLNELDDALESQDYPTTTDELVEAYGDYEIETQHGTESLEEVLASTSNQTYDSADDARSRILGLIHR